MAGERDIYWGADPTDAQYRSGDDDASNRFVVAEDTDGGTILLEYDETAGEWVSRGAVNLDGNDITGVGTLSASAVNTEQANIGPDTREWGDRIDLFAVGGQSNAEGKGDDTTSPNVDATTAIEYSPSGDSITSPLDDPVGDGETDGSAWPAFAQAYHRQTSRKIAIVMSAVGGSAMDSGADAGSGSWDSNGTLRDDLITDVNNAKAKLDAQGYDVHFRGVLWSQGERDAQAIDSGSITKSDYQDAFSNLVDYWESQFNEDFKLYVAQTGEPNTGDTAGFADVRDAQTTVCLSKPASVLASSIQDQFPSLGHMTDDLHYNQTGLDIMGRRLSSSVSADVSRNPAAAAAELTSAGNNAANGTYTEVPLDSVSVEGGVSTVDLANNQITINDEGIYMVVAQSTVNSPPDGSRLVFRLRKNGVSSIATYDKAVGGAISRASVSVMATFVGLPGDDISAELFQDSGSSLEFSSGGRRNRIGVTQISAL